MLFVSTEGISPPASAAKAVLSGLAPDGGLYVPMEIPRIPHEALVAFSTYSFAEIAYHVCDHFFGEDLSSETIDSICHDAFSFPTVLTPISSNSSFLELFHGPTMAFKDYGARFMARLIPQLLKDSRKRTVVLVATSGDTGGAVAQGFYKVPGVEVVVLYPKDRVSSFQEQQFATLGENITALRVHGSFDDCQRMVKQALGDVDLRSRITLASANSINIARLIPQTIYYLWAIAQRGCNEDVVFSVPSGNFGNLTAGMIARRLGAPIHALIAATNANSVVPEYLERGEFKPRASVATLSNAMDVGNPSNFARMQWLTQNKVERLRDEVFGVSCPDTLTEQTMTELWKRYRYQADPHTAVGWYGLNEFRKARKWDGQGIVLATAHPVKFYDVAKRVLGEAIEAPSQVLRPLLSQTVNADVAVLKHLLLKA